MKAPLPDPFEQEQTRIEPTAPPAVHARPAVLLPLICADCVVTGIGFYTSKFADILNGWAVLAAFWIAIVFRLWLLYGIWRGRNWARIVLILLSVMNVTGMIAAYSQNTLHPLYSIARFAVSIAWLVFLTRPATVAFTKQHRSPKTASR